MLNIRYLTAVRAVMRSGSISAAARVLHVTQPAVTKSIQQAEDELGLKLFARVKGRLVPTEESTFLVPEIERIFGDITHLETMADEIRQGHTGRIALASVANLSASVLSRAMTRFHKRHPNIRFDVEVLNTRNVLDRVRLGQVSFGLLDVSAKDQGVGVLELCSTQIGCVMPINHPLHKQEVITPKHLADETLITFSDDTVTNAGIREAFRRAGVRCHITFTLNQTHSAYSLVQAGNGLGLLDPFPLLYKEAFPKLTVRPFVPSLRLVPTIVFSESRPVSLMTRTFIEDLQAITRELVEAPKSLFGKV
jgi:DNA-binding transcriptional LysR family regulator